MCGNEQQAPHVGRQFQTESEMYSIRVQFKKCYTTPFEVVFNPSVKTDSFIMLTLVGAIGAIYCMLLLVSVTLVLKCFNVCFRYEF